AGSSARCEPAQTPGDERDPAAGLERDPDSAKRSASLAAGRAPGDQRRPRQEERQHQRPRRDTKRTARLLRESRLADSAAVHVADEISIRVELGVVNDGVRCKRKSIAGGARAPGEVGVVTAGEAKTFVEAAQR